MDSNSKIIYFDNAAKTIPYKEVEDCFINTYHQYFANPSSIHFEGVKANRFVDKTKENILRKLKLINHKMVFLSSATEANNLAIKGFALKYSNRGKHIICSSYEHPSVIEVMEQLKNDFGFEITYVNPNKDGFIEVSDIIKEIRNDTILVSVMAVNNEIGTINPIEEIAIAMQKYPKLVFHVDAAQAIGKINLNYNNVDMITAASHKIHGLSTGGALFIKKNIELMPLLSGGGQEYGLRSGTVDIASLASLGVAVELSINNIDKHFNLVKELSDKLYEYLYSRPDLFHVNSDRRNPYIINFSTITKKGSVVVEALSRSGIMVSSTSACSSYKQKGSYVVKSIFDDENIANNTVRVSFSYLNTIDEVNVFIQTLDKIIGEIR